MAEGYLDETVSPSPALYQAKMDPPICVSKKRPVPRSERGISLCGGRIQPSQQDVLCELEQGGLYILSNGLQLPP